MGAGEYGGASGGFGDEDSARGGGVHRRQWQASIVTEKRERWRGEEGGVRLSFIDGGRRGVEGRGAGHAEVIRSLSIRARAACRSGVRHYRDDGRKEARGRRKGKKKGTGPADGWASGAARGKGARRVRCCGRGVADVHG